MIESVRRTIEKYHMLAPGAPVLAALSGGADSVCLLRVLLALGYSVRAYHLNHCLRGAESDRDEAFCRDLCESLGVPLTVERADAAAYAAGSGQSVETAARQLRYQRLEKAAQGGRIATAHTADDNLETVLFHLARGTGPKGLCGIPPVRGDIIRPLIETERSAVERYLAALEQPYVTDSTNRSDVYTRNRIRQHVVPVLRQINPAVTDAAARLGALLRQDEDYLSAQAEALAAQAAGGNGAWRVSPLTSAHPAVRSRALRVLAQQAGMPMRDLSAVHLKALEALALSQDPTAVCSLPHGFTAYRTGAFVRLERTDRIRQQGMPLHVPYEGAPFGAGTRLRVCRLQKNEDIYKTFNTFCVECGTIILDSLCVRAVRLGERLQLPGAQGSRTIKRLLSDRHISRERGAQLLAVADEKGLIAVQDIGIDSARAPQGGVCYEIKFEG